MRTITKIESSVPVLPKKTRVAAYARISLEKGRTMNSLSAQISYYNDIIQKNPDWEFAGVYADSGISGTGIEAREEFKKLLADCDAGKIDVVLTKSISRFARNTVDLLETVRHLKERGIEVRFEKECINSLSGDGELMLSILASFAQEEVESLSNNVKWATRKRMQKGIPNGRFRIFGYTWEGDRLIVVPEEAEIVKRIYQNFLDGKSRLETERELAAAGITTRAGCRWMDSNIRCVLTNITYTGNLLLQKEYVESPITHKRKKNKGELPQYFVENTHEAIIDMDTFQYVQSEIARRKELGALANKSLNTCCFTGKIKCPHCNMSYIHNSRRDRGSELEFWTCGTMKKAGGRCIVGGGIPFDILKKETAKALDLESFDEDVFLAKIDYISVPKRKVLEFHFKDGDVITRTWVSTAKIDMWTPERKALWSEYLYAGRKAKTGLSFNEFMAQRKETESGKGSKNDTCNGESI